MKKTSIQVQNLKCGGCAKTITSSLEKMEAVQNVAVDVDTATVSFECPNGEAAQKVAATLKILGYPAMDANNSLFTKAKSYISCATGKMDRS